MAGKISMNADKSKPSNTMGKVSKKKAIKMALMSRKKKAKFGC